jgi:hypothetical protein
MRLTSRKRSFSLRVVASSAFLILFILCASPVLASTTDKLVVRDSVSLAHREELARRLRRITGWTDLTFANDGGLQTNLKQITGGSKTARELLNTAIAGDRTILFEDASSRKDVVFCRVVLGKLDSDGPIAEEVHVVQIDFDDFRQVIGDKQALAAFDVGWAVLHEIDHVVSDSEDPDDDTEAGDCEGHINKMRRELGLPVRNNYFYTFLPIKNDSNLVSRFVRLGFEQEAGPAAKRRRYWLIWDAAVVGGLSGA